MEISNSQAVPSPENLHPLITEGRQDGNCWYVKTTKYQKDMELVAIKLDSEDRFRRGGGSARKNSSKTQMDDKTLKKSQQRSKRTIKQRCLQAEFDRILTLTFKFNLQDIDEAWRVFKYFIKLMKKRYPNLTYLVVPEYQKRGAVHFHIAIKGYIYHGTVRRIWRRAAGTYGGNVDITNPKNYGRFNTNKRRYSWRSSDIANYLSKYLTKDETVEFNRRRYASGGVFTAPTIIRGFIARGFPMHRLARDVFSKFRHSINFEWESEEGFFPIHYYST